MTDGEAAAAGQLEDDELRTEDPLVVARNLTKHFYEQDSILDRLLGDEPVAIRAVDGIDFDIGRGETLGLVGESGCGKSTAGETLLRLQEPTDGVVEFDGDILAQLDGEGMDRFRRDAQIVFQDPFSSLDPRMTIGETVQQPLDVHDWPTTDDETRTTAAVTTEGVDEEVLDVTVADDVDKLVAPEDGVATVQLRVETVPEVEADAGNETGAVSDDRAVDIDDGVRVAIEEELTVTVNVDRQQGSLAAVDVSVSIERSAEELRRDRVKQLLNRVGLSGDQFDRYPHEFSGGQRQRVGIARALALDPEFVVLDEPTSALDVSVQAQILNLLSELQTEFNLTYLLISHDLSVIRHICDRVAVMYLGELVEIAPSEEIFADPQHPYTEALLESVPRVDTDERDREIETLTGDVPSPRDPPSGCRFRTRCPVVIPPAEMNVDQDEYRAVLTVRERLRNRDLDVEGARTLATEATDASTDAGEPDEEEVIDRVLEPLLDVDLSEPHRSRVRDAVAVAVDGDWDRAEAELSDYRSVCEVASPELPLDTSHPAACHRRPQPPEMQEAIEEAAVSPAIDTTTDGDTIPDPDA